MHCLICFSAILSSDDVSMYTDAMNMFKSSSSVEAQGEVRAISSLHGNALFTCFTYLSPRCFSAMNWLIDIPSNPQASTQLITD